MTTQQSLVAVLAALAEQFLNQIKTSLQALGEDGGRGDRDECCLHIPMYLAGDLNPAHTKRVQDHVLGVLDSASCASRSRAWPRRPGSSGERSAAAA